MAELPGTGAERALPRLQALLLNVSDLDSVLTELAQIAATVVPGASLACGITLRYDGSLLTVGSSDTRAELLDETQYQTRQGPCLESLQDGRVVEVADVRVERRWPDYLPRARETGLRCSLSLPLSAGAETFGAMNVYGFDQPDLFGEPERRQLELFAAQAEGTLRVATRLWKDKTLLEQMERALGSRTVIDQALGIVMAQQRCTATVAFDLIRRESQNSRRLLRDVAADLVTRTSGETPEDGRGFDQG